MKHRNSDDIERIVNLKFEVAKGEEEIKFSTKNHEDNVKKLSEGYDVENDKEITSVQERHERLVEMTKDHMNNYIDLQEKQLNLENELDDEEEIIVQRKERTPKKKSFLPHFLIGLVTTSLLAGSAAILHIKKNEGIIEGKTAEYAAELDQVVKEASSTRIGNLTYKDGEVKEVLSGDEYIATSEYQCIDYQEIASYIENSEDPDLAAFVLYYNYGKSDLPKYNKITTKTFKALEFDNSKVGSIENFSKYLYENGYSSYKEYEKACKKELLEDDDNTLDNIKVKINKKTK